MRLLKRIIDDHNPEWRRMRRKQCTIFFPHTVTKAYFSNYYRARESVSADHERIANITDVYASNLHADSFGYSIVLVEIGVKAAVFEAERRFKPQGKLLNCATLRFGEKTQHFTLTLQIILARSLVLLLIHSGILFLVLYSVSVKINRMPSLLNNHAKWFLR